MVNEERIVRCEVMAPSSDVVEIDPGVFKRMPDSEGVIVSILWSAVFSGRGIEGPVGVTDRIIEAHCPYKEVLAEGIEPQMFEFKLWRIAIADTNSIDNAAVFAQVVDVIS